MSRAEPPAAWNPHAPRSCRWCGQPLSALARARGEVCDATDCRRRDVDARAQAQRNADLDAARHAAAVAWDAPALATAPLLWLRHHGSDLVATGAAEHAALRAHLLALESDAQTPQGDAPEAAGVPSTVLGGQLCALCRGRCCRLGLQGHAYLEARDLRAWLAQQAGASWVDAVEHWLAFVGPEHLHESCLFHGPQGCSLPRERRSDVCNRFECATLEQARGVSDSQAVVVVGIVEARAIRAATAVSATGSRALPGYPP
jgi:hypothetical protein